MLNERDQLTCPPPPFIDPDPTLGPAALAIARRAVGPPPRDPLCAVAAGLEDCAPADHLVPALRIWQPQERRDELISAGTWFLHDRLLALDGSLELVVLEVRKQRALLLPEDELYLDTRVREAVGWITLAHERRWPVCSSLDGLRPERGPRRLPLAEACGACSFAGRGCSEGYRLLVVEARAGEFVAEFHATGLAARAVQELITDLQLACRRDRAPSCAFSVLATTTQEDGPEGPEWVPCFDPPEALDRPEWVTGLVELRQALIAGKGA